MGILIQDFGAGGDRYLWTSSTFYKAVFQANLLFGSKTWVVTPKIGRTLGGFHHRMAHCLVVMEPKQNIVGR